jgi:hypothetical protein
MSPAPRIMTDRPIIFSAPMVRALLEGRKSQTRRVLKPQPWLSMAKKWNWEPTGKRPFCTWWDGPPYIQITDALPMDQAPWAIGDRLWVRETWWPCDERIMAERWRGGIVYKADGGHDEMRRRWRSPIHLPRWASRLTLEVTGVKVERLQEIGGADAIAEGCVVVGNSPPPLDQFADLWNAIYGPGAWDKNPWVYALTFNAMI